LTRVNAKLTSPSKIVRIDAGGAINDSNNATLMSISVGTDGKRINGGYQWCINVQSESGVDRAGF
jgi:hypothetical protein